MYFFLHLDIAQTYGGLEKYIEWSKMKLFFKSLLTLSTS